MGTQPTTAMPAKKSIEPVFVPSRDRWKVDVPASMSGTGRRIRCHFKTRAAAREYADRVEDFPALDKALDPRLALDASEARERLNAAGADVSLRDVIVEWLNAKAALQGTGTLVQAAESFAGAHAARTASKPFKDAADAFLVAKDGLREKTLSGYRSSLLRAFASLHDRTLADIGPDDLAPVFDRMSAGARPAHFRCLRAFWKWAAKPPRQWCNESVIAGLEFASPRSDEDITVLSPDECRALLTAAEGWSGNAAVAFAVAIFGGVRSAELAKLRWRDINGEYVVIGKHAAKKHARRLVPITPTLKAWIDAHRPGDAEEDDLVVGPRWVEVSQGVRRLAGWRVSARILETQPEPTRGPWPQNVARHTAASLMVAIGVPLDELVFSFGHAEGVQMLRRHYVGRMTRKQAREILEIGPNGEKVSLPLKK